MTQTSVPHIIPHPGDGLANFSAIISWPWKLIYGVTCNPGVPQANKVMDGWWPIHNYSRILPPEHTASATSLLFNLQDDEGEHNDLADKYPDVVNKLRGRISDFYASKKHGFRRAQLNIPHPLANPRFHNWTWSPWLPS